MDPISWVSSAAAFRGQYKTKSAEELEAELETLQDKINTQIDEWADDRLLNFLICQIANLETDKRMCAALIVAHVEIPSLHHDAAWVHSKFHLEARAGELVDEIVRLSDQRDALTVKIKALAFQSQSAPIKAELAELRKPVLPPTYTDAEPPPT
jgi:hypothetical protein